MSRALTDASRQRAQRQAEWIDAAFRTVPVAMSFVDRDLRYLKVNAYTAAITGVAEDAHVGRTLREVNPRLTDEMENLIRRVVETGEPALNYHLRRPTPHAKSGMLSLVMHVSPFIEADGSIAGACITATDVTAWTDLQANLHRAQQLSAVGELAAGVAHDFNNLVTIVTSLCDLILMESPADAVHRGDIEEIQRAANRAAALARRMLGASHHRVLKPRPVELRAVVDDARDLMTQATRKAVRLVVRHEDTRGVVVADPTQLEQVLLNLVINAVDATPAGGTITVATRDVELDQAIIARTGELAAGSYAEVTVTDTGSGMDQSVAARIFEPFFTTKESKGTGLGLATVFAIVRDLGGGIDVTTTPGAGTTFTILLPRATTEESTGPRRARAAHDASLPRGTETILLVEDEDVLRASVARVLTRQGYRVVEAHHGGDALRRMASGERFSMVVSDLHMPGVNGYEMSARMRAMGYAAPVLFISGSSGPDAAPPVPPPLHERDRFLEKPVPVEALLTTIREMLQPA